MKKFLVAFKTPKKTFKIDSQDEKQATLWAEEQLKAWKKKSKYVITEVDQKSEPKPETKEAKAEKPAPAPTAPAKA